MYIRKPELRWKVQDVPSLNYRIRCEGGNYTLWLLSKFNSGEEGFFGIGVDEENIPEDKLYANGNLWRYEAEQVYRFVPAAQIELEKGEHTIHIFVRSLGMRYDRFCLASCTLFS